MKQMKFEEIDKGKERQEDHLGNLRKKIELLMLMKMGRLRRKSRLQKFKFKLKCH